MNTYTIGIALAIGLFGFAGLSGIVDWWRAKNARLYTRLMEDIPETLLTSCVSGMTVRWFEYRVWPWNRHLVRRVLRQLESDQVVVVSGEPTDDNRFVRLNPRYLMLNRLEESISYLRGLWLNERDYDGEPDFGTFFRSLASQHSSRPQLNALFHELADEFSPQWRQGEGRLDLGSVPELAKYPVLQGVMVYDVTRRVELGREPARVPWNGGK